MTQHSRLMAWERAAFVDQSQIRSTAVRMSSASPPAIPAHPGQEIEGGSRRPRPLQPTRTAEAAYSRDSDGWSASRSTARTGPRPTSLPKGAASCAPSPEHGLPSPSLSRTASTIRDARLATSSTGRGQVVNLGVSARLRKGRKGEGLRHGAPLRRHCRGRSRTARARLASRCRGRGGEDEGRVISRATSPTPGNSPMRPSRGPLRARTG